MSHMEQPLKYDETKDQSFMQVEQCFSVSSD